MCVLALNTVLEAYLLARGGELRCGGESVRSRWSIAYIWKHRSRVSCIALRL